ncbi:hypothetical protein [Terrisporobacter sp.]
MNSIKCIENYFDTNRRIRRAVIFGAATAGVAAGVYVGVKKITNLIEDKKLARYYEDEIEEIFKEKEEREELETAINEFNSRRLKREDSPSSEEKKDKEF